MSSSGSVQRLLDLLKQVQKSGTGWTALCPAHSDSQPSLSVSEGEDGKALVHCHAGCSPEKVVAAVGLSMSDLFSGKHPAPHRSHQEGEEVYRYLDLRGSLLFEVVRSRSSGGQKKFLQRRCHEGRQVWALKAGRYKLSGDGSYRPLKPNDAAGGSIVLPAVEKVLYRLPTLPAAIQDGSWVLICEGEKDAENGAELGFTTTTNPGGASKWQESYTQALKGARVAIIPDNDEPGRLSAVKIAASLSSQGNEVRTIELGGTAKGYDLSDWIAEQRCAGLTAPAIYQALLEKIEEAAGSEPPPRPQVVVGSNRLQVTDQAEVLLGGRPEIYRRGGTLVQIIAADLAEPGITPAAPAIGVASPARILEVLSDCADWICARGIPGPPPDWVARTLLGRGNWPKIRRLEGIVEFPILRPDGTIFQIPGYDVRTGLVYQPNGQYPRLPELRDREAARQAGRRLRDVVGDFPFETEADASAWLAGLLTILARHAFSGPSPLFIVNADVAGAGKTLLVDLVSVIALGRPAPRMTLAESDAEERKRITSLLMAGDPIVLIDNVDRPIGSAPLDSALTGTSWTDRMLGSNLQVTLPQKMVFFATGNDVRVKGDTQRRSLGIQLFASSDSPDRRTGFRHPLLLEWVADHRPALLVEALTILVSYFEAGRPDLVTGSWGSFEGWSAVVRNAVVWAGFPDPCEKRDAVQVEVEPDDEVVARMLEGWEEAEHLFGGPLAIRQIHEGLESKPENPLREALSELCGKRAGLLPSPREIGNRFKALQGRSFGGRQLCQVGKKTNLGVTWTVRSSNGAK